ncbi:MAG: hypothetical protein JNK49_04315 [Planctomycetes bacterium]|nr:hypothetical protein [Planctomycetota bacterium]
MTRPKAGTLALGIAILALLVWLGTRNPAVPAPAAPGQQPSQRTVPAVADNQADDSRQPVVAKNLEPAARENPEPNAGTPWSEALVGTPEKYGSLPHDHFGYPTELRPYLHRMLNPMHSWGVAEGRDPASGSYVPKLGEILKSLPSGFSDLAKLHEPTLAAIVRKYALGAHPIEIEHWRSRLHAYHLAIENGDFVVVDNTAYPMTSEGNQERAANNRRHLDQLNLGVMNRDYFYVTSSSRSRANEVGMYSALIYITRNKYPEPFLLLDEVVKLKQQAEREVREYLGIR